MCEVSVPYSREVSVADHGLDGSEESYQEKPPMLFHGRPAQCGLYDLRMGPTPGQSFLCATCENTEEGCPGHFGHIELAEPVFHPLFLSTIHKILCCVCQNCGQLLLKVFPYVYRIYLLGKACPA